MNSRVVAEAHRPWKALTILALAAAFCVAPLGGQSFYGSIVGSVTDRSGASIAGAQVTVTSIATSEKRTAAADESGFYRFPNLYPGDYRLEIQRSGFKILRREPVSVTVDAVVRIDAVLEVGGVTESIEVTAETPLIQSQTSSLGQVIEDRHVLEMPLNGRNVMNLVALAPGVVPQGGALGAPTGKNVFTWGNYQIGGGEANQGASAFDGAPLNVSYVNLTTLIPTQDAVQEFKVQTNNLSAEFGRFAGGVINLTSRGGTNSFHGAAYEFLRNKALNANTFFNNSNKVSRPPFTQNQFGASLGGPIKKDKLFFYTSYEGYRQRTGRSFLLSVPTAKMRDGDFSEVTNRVIHDPFSVKGVNDLPRKPLPGNIVPKTMLDPVAVKLKDLYAMPNQPGMFNNFATNASAGGDQNQYNNRADYTLSEKQRIFGRWTYWRNNTRALDPFQTKTYFEWGPETTLTNQIVLGDTYLLSPSMILDVRAGYLRFSYDRMAETAGYDLSSLGWPAALNSQVSFRHVPFMCVEDYTFFCGNGTGSFIYNRAETYSLAPTLNWVRGSHQLKFGGDFRRQVHNYAQTDNSSGSFTFNRAFTANNPFQPTGGFGMASFMLGTGDGGQSNTAFAASQILYAALFVNDSWQVTRKLTLNLGLRWDRPGPFSERYDRLTVLLPGEQHRLAKPTGLPLVGTLALVNSDLRPSRNNQNRINQFAPRFGFAYAWKPATVIRGGYGIFYLPIDISIPVNPAWDPLNKVSNPMVGTIDGVTPNNLLRNPFPNGVAPAGIRSADAVNRFDGLGVTAVIPGLPQPYVQQWNLNIQQEIRGWLLDTAYVGSKGTHLQVGTQELNQLPDQYLALGQGLFEQVKNPFYGLITTGTLSAQTVQRGQLLRPFPQFTSVGAAAMPNRSSIYHAFQFKLEKRFAQGGNLLFSYTGGKTISDASTLTGWVEPTTSTRRCSNNNLRDCRTLSPWDVAQRGVVSYVYDLPFGKGKQFLSSAKGFGGYLISGWGLNGVVTFQSGFPVAIVPQLNTSNSFGGGQRANNDGRSAKLDGAAQSRLTRWFDRSVFSAATPYTFGNTSTFLPDTRTHGIANWDVAVFKNNRITESVGLQFRLELFNTFNRVQFGPPNITQGSPLFGTVNSQLNDPRLVQLAMRLMF